VRAVVCRGVAPPCRTSSAPGRLVGRSGAGSGSSPSRSSPRPRRARGSCTPLRNRRSTGCCARWASTASNTGPSERAHWRWRHVRLANVPVDVPIGGVKRVQVRIVWPRVGDTICIGAQRGRTAGRERDGWVVAVNVHDFGQECSRFHPVATPRSATASCVCVESVAPRFDEHKTEF
jgi:hypothetical protein